MHSFLALLRKEQARCIWQIWQWQITYLTDTLHKIADIPGIWVLIYIKGFLARGPLVTPIGHKEDV